MLRDQFSSHSRKYEEAARRLAPSHCWAVDAALGIVQAAFASIIGPHHDEFALQERLRLSWTGARLPAFVVPGLGLVSISLPPKRRDLLLGNQERADEEKGRLIIAARIGVSGGWKSSGDSTSVETSRTRGLPVFPR